MANFRSPGPICQLLGPWDIDAGTLCLEASPAPGPLPVVPAPINQRHFLRLDADSVRMQELVAHLDEREGNYQYFYCDHNGLVTIGIGHLIDRAGRPDQVGRERARALAAEVQFTHKRSGSPATPVEVVQDWQRVKDLYRTRINGGDRPGGARTYRNAARLQITQEEGRQLSETKVTTYINRLYRRRPALSRVDSYVTMALVDVLYNPAGVPLFGTRHRMPALWAALDDNDPDYDLDEALRLFEAIWRHRGRARYKQRHQMRVSWFRRGVASMQAP
jgi:hypothetical protein